MFSGPGTKLKKRLERGDKGVNKLDDLCRNHDIAYSQNSNLEERHKADQILSEKAIERFKAKDSSFGEKIAALGVAGIMKTKLKLGAGIKKKKKKKTVSFNIAMRRARAAIKRNNPSDFTDASNIAINAFKGVNKIKKSRVIPVPKTGGILPLLPIFAGLSALGALAGGGAQIASAINKTKAAQNALKESNRHNEQMEAIAIGKGLYLKPYKKGLGLYINKKKKKFQSVRSPTTT